MGLVDWLSGAELGVSAFYVPGIALTAWYSTRRVALYMAIFAALVWLISDLGSTKVYSQTFIPYWNSAIRGTIFCTIALLASEVRIRQRVEVALRHQQEILASVLDSLRDGVVVSDQEEKIIIANPAAHRIFGRIPQDGDVHAWVDHLQKSVLEPNPSSLKADYPLQQAVAGKISGHWELTLRPDGNDQRTQLGMTSLPLEGGEKTRSGVILVFNDLTARRMLENQISQASEREQRRIGQDLHDGVCQHLAGVAFSAEALQGNLVNSALPNHAAAAGEIATMVREGIRQTRDLARGLYPDGIEEGLATALQSLASVTTRRSSVPCHFQQSSGDFPLDPVAAGHIYRIAQECVTNAVRHGSPRNIHITLERQEKALMLEIRDDGAGLGSSKNADRGIGLQIMRYRANLISGKLDIFSRDGEGTRIQLRAPLLSQVSA